MKLINLHIYNFGCLSDFKYEFNENLNIIKEDNGFGKTTLATFIKFMFYGFENLKTNDIKKSEKKKYLPWNGSIASGELTFEINNKTYKIIRSYGGNLKKDEFYLYDYLTNKQSFDYTEKIGFEIFNIGVNSFEKSCFVKKTENTTFDEDIQNRLTNLVEGSGDSFSFEVGKKRLEEKKRKLYANVNNGEIVVLEKEIRSLKEKISLENYYLSEQEKLNIKIKELDCMIKENTLKQKDLQELIHKASLANAKKEVISQLNKLQNDLKNLKENKDNFKNIINETDLNTLKDNYKNIIVINHKEEILKESNAFKRKNQFNRNMLNSYTENKLTQEFIDELSLKVKSLNSFNIDLNYTNILNKCKDEIKQSKLNIIISICLSFIFLILTIFFFITNIFYVLITIPFLIISLCSFFYFKNKNILKLKEKHKLIKDEIIIANDLNNNTLEKILTGKSSNYSSCLNSIRDEASKRSDLESYLKSVFNSFGIKCYEISLLQTEFNLIKDIVNETTLLENQLHELKKDKYILNSKIETILNKYNCSLYNIEDEINKLEIVRNEFINLENNILVKEKEINDFIKDKNITDDFYNNETDFTLNNSIDELLNENKTLNSKKITFQNELDEIDEKLTSINEFKEILEETITSLDNLKKEYEYIKLTISYLEKAKDKLSSTYINPMKNSFMGYLKQISNDFSDCSLDTSLNILVNSPYGSKTINYFSNGYLDIFDFCLRLSLVDNIFVDLTPFLVLDDPFINLDDTKMGYILDLLEEISKSKQIIYLVCNSSRVKEN